MTIYPKEKGYYQLKKFETYAGGEDKLVACYDIMTYQEIKEYYTKSYSEYDERDNEKTYGIDNTNNLLFVKRNCKYYYTAEYIEQ